MCVALNQITNTVMQSGADPSMGRWSWMLLRGKHDVKTIVITAYRPCKNNKGYNTVYSQQLRFLTAKQLDICPRKAWLDDLKAFIQNKIASGIQIILMGDFNENVNSKQIQSWAQSIGLEEIVSSSTENIIATQNSGSSPIDGNYVSPSLTVQYSGYLPFGVFQTDHRALWADLTQSSVFGFKIPKSISPQIRRLQCNVPHVREAWIRHYTQFLRKHKVIEKQFELEAQITSNIITDIQAQQFEKILQLCTEGINYAKKRCQKIYCGQVPFSPEVQKARL